MSKMEVGSSRGDVVEYTSHPHNAETEHLEAKVHREQLELRGKVSRDLVITSPEGCPQKLTDRIREYDARYEVFYEGWNGLDKLYAKLPILRANGAPAEKIAAAASKALQSHYDALVQFIELLHAGEPLLRESADVLEKLREKREREVEREWREVAQLLKDAGFAPEDHPKYSDAPDAIRHQFRFTVDRSARVQNRRLFVEQIQSRQSQLRAWADATPRDVEHVEAARDVVFARLAGPAFRW